MPTTIAVSATNDDSSRKHACTMLPAEPDRPQDADLLAALDHRAGADDAERGDADDQAEAHEALDQPVEREARGDGVGEHLLDRVGLHAVGEERRLERLGGARRIGAGREREEVDGRHRAVAERRGQRRLRRPDARPS